MKRFFSRNYRFELETVVRCKFPPYLKSAIAPAVAAALETIPRATLKTKLDSEATYQINVALVGPAEIRRLNKNYRAKDKPTDVLSFSRFHDEIFPGTAAQIGDLAICWKVARAQTKTFGTSVRGELQRLVVHGMLHLFGYDHELGEREARLMFRLQEKALALPALKK